MFVLKFSGWNAQTPVSPKASSPPRPQATSSSIATSPSKFHSCPYMHNLKYLTTRSTPTTSAPSRCSHTPSGISQACIEHSAFFPPSSSLSCPVRPLVKVVVIGHTNYGGAQAALAAVTHSPPPHVEHVLQRRLRPLVELARRLVGGPPHSEIPTRRT